MTVNELTAAGFVARRPSFLILVAISAIGPLALNIFMPSMPGLQKTFGISYGTVQLTLTLYLVGMAACQLFYGPMSDRFGRRPLLPLACHCSCWPASWPPWRQTSRC
jgi:MFS family permease